MATVKLVQRVMGNAYELDIPLKTDAKAGKSWGDMQILHV
jgi:DNA polymerase I-like protein with 3'-5' exonuclease and polymerase domains